MRKRRRSRRRSSLERFCPTQAVSGSGKTVNLCLLEVVKFGGYTLEGEFMNRLVVASGIALYLSAAGSAALAQGSNPGISTTPGLTTPNQPGNPSNPVVNVQSIQNLPVGPQPPTSGVSSTLQFVPINVTAPQVIPSRFGTANVMSTVTPQPTISQPLPTVTTSNTTTTTLTPTQSTFTFTPSQSFVPITTPRPYNPPSTNGFSPR